MVGGERLVYRIIGKISSVEMSIKIFASLLNSNTYVPQHTLVNTHPSDSEPILNPPFPDKRGSGAPPQNPTTDRKREKKEGDSER